MPIAHLAPYYTRHPFDFQDLEHPTRTWLRTALAELPEVWRNSSEQEVDQSLKVLLSLHQAGLLEYQPDWLESLQLLTSRPGWQSENWLPSYLNLLTLAEEPAALQVRLALAEHPQPEIRRQAYLQHSPIPPGFNIRLLGQTLTWEDESPLFLRGLQDPDEQILQLSLNYFCEWPLAETPSSLREQFFQLTQHQEAAIRSRALLALAKAHEPNLESVLQRHFEQAPNPECQAILLNAWACHQRLWPDVAIGDVWHQALKMALSTENPALLSAAAQAVGTLGLSELENALDPLFASQDLQVKTALVQAILALESRCYAQQLFESLQLTEDIRYRILCLTALVKLHPDFSRQHLAQVMLTEPALAHRLVTELRALGWREIPRTWLEVAAVTPPEPTPLSAIEPLAPWLEV